MLKKTVALGMTMALATTIFAGCGDDTKQGEENNQGGDTKTADIPETLTVGFIPSQNAETLSAKAKPMGDLLSKELDMDVKVVVTTNYTALIEGMAAKQIDVGFLSPVDYVFAHDNKKAVNLLLQTVRNGSSSYKSMFVKRADDTSINKLEDVKGKRIAFVSASSAAGYTYPAAMLKDAGIDPEKDVQGQMAGGHDKALAALYRGDVDVATVFDDARDQMIKEYPDVKEKLVPFVWTEEIPNDTVSIRNDLPEDFQKKVQQAFINIMKTDEGKKIGKDIYSFDDLVPGKDSNFDPVRKVIKAMNLQEAK
ncbi:MAG TPA: phosphate/phosphite/phosphonate ABC transporter substrate-binding protein [Bacilli bacterium]|nr:phosphate/phosphite/phosphonate ABC transporter substrate-binding protein [Bacilli bacterium]